MDKVNSKYKNKQLYIDVKNEISKKYSKHSAYRSMAIQKEYKSRGGIIEGDNKKDLKKWRKEKWINLTPYALGDIKKITDAPKCGEKHPKQGNNKSICRPSKRINKKTPKLARSYTKEEIKKALKLKNLGVKKIEWQKL